MTKLQEAREAIRLENIQDDNKALSVLNDTFSKWEFDNTKYNNVVLKGILQGNKKVKYYIIANSILLEIKDSSKIYNYEINGTAGKNTKQIKELELPFNRNSTLTLLDILF